MSIRSGLQLGWALVIISSFVGCSSTLRIEADSCMEEARWYSEQEQESSFLITHKVRSYDLDLKPSYFLPLSEMLWKRGVKCGQLDSLYLSVETNFIGALLNLIPFVISREITLVGTTRIIQNKRSKSVTD